jgi:hypothetical protein
MILPFAAPFALNPIAMVVAGAWRWIAAALLVGGLLLWIAMSAYRHGAAHERAAWEARAANAATRAAKDTQTRQTTKDTAQSTATRRADTYARTRAPLTREVIRYVQTPAAAVACPDPAGVRVGAAAIAAANAAIAAR